MLLFPPPWARCFKIEWVTYALQSATNASIVLQPSKIAVSDDLIVPFLESKSATDSKNKKNKAKRPKKDSTDDEGMSDLVIAEDAISPSKSRSAPTTPKQPNLNNSNNKKRKKRDSASSDEERWLTAIESGKLEDVDDELKKIKPKDPALMTARQRAMYDRSSDGSPAVAPTLMSLPTGYKVYSIYFL